MVNEKNLNTKSRLIVVTRFERVIYLLSETEVTGHQVMTFISQFDAVRARHKHNSERLLAFGAFMESKGFKSLPAILVHEI